MSIAEKLVRQSVSLPARVARQVKTLAKTSNASANRVIVDLIESGIEAEIARSGTVPHQQVMDEARATIARHARAQHRHAA